MSKVTAQMHDPGAVRGFRFHVDLAAPVSIDGSYGKLKVFFSQRPGHCYQMKCPPCFEKLFLRDAVRVHARASRVEEMSMISYRCFYDTLLGVRLRRSTAPTILLSCMSTLPPPLQFHAFPTSICIRPIGMRETKAIYLPILTKSTFYVTTASSAPCAFTKWEYRPNYGAGKRCQHSTVLVDSYTIAVRGQCTLQKAWSRDN